MRGLPQAGEGGRCALVTDDRVQALHAGAALESLRGAGFSPALLAVPAGEASKSLHRVEELCEGMAAAGLDRGSLVVALGGGVVGDLAGFAAAVFGRGIPVVQVPTTVMAQVDSSVGGKTGVNLRAGKNLVGAFHPPALVVADVETLRTLPPREWNEGWAEAAKHGVIADRALLNDLARLARSDDDAVAAMVARNVRIKASVVAADEFERAGRRELLNFGHTLGHALETAAGYGTFLHGEAVAVGMMAAARLSRRLAGLPVDDEAALEELLLRLGLPVRFPAGVSTDALIEAMRRDKKFRAGRLRFVLTPRLGEALVSDDVDEEAARAAIGELRAAPIE